MTAFGEVRIAGMGLNPDDECAQSNPIGSEDRSRVRYTSPERTMFGEMSSEDDVYSLGAILSLLLCGAWPMRLL
jgi:serine/threonine protein kinase